MELPQNNRRQTVFNVCSQNFNTFLDGQSATAQLYRHQIEAVQGIRNYFNDVSKQNIALVVIPTGAGKTGIAVMAAYAVNASQVLVITPSQRISEQISREFSGDNAFLVERGIFPSAMHRARCLPQTGIVKSSEQMSRMYTSELVIVNAHKITKNTSVTIDDIPDVFDLVIVDEAHHYPAKTWKQIVDHFPNSRRLFLTATPKYRGGDILPNQPEFHCYRYLKIQAIREGIIREIEFNEDIKVDMEEEDTVNEDTDEFIHLRPVFAGLARKIKLTLDEHDRLEPNHFHQAMILTQSKIRHNPATLFKEVYNDINRGEKERCECYLSGEKRAVVRRFTSGEFRSLVIIGRLLEGFDHKNVSVVAIARNVGPSSRVLFEQFVGRAVRKTHPADLVKATILSHPRFKQLRNYQSFEELPDEDIVDDEDDDEEVVEI